MVATICIVIVSLLVADTSVQAALDTKTKLIVGFFSVILAMIAIVDAFRAGFQKRHYT